jgi:sugar diacid utilization regulator
MMQRARPLESDKQPEGTRGAASAAPLVSPLTIVSGAVAGDDLQRVAASASDAIGQPVAIAIPALGEPVVWPAGALPEAELRAVVEAAAAVVRGEAPGLESVPVRIGSDVVGVVVAAGGAPSRDQLSWLEAAAAAAAVTALMREAQEGGIESSRRALLQALGAGPPADVAALVRHARRLGFDLSAGAIAVCAASRGEDRAVELPGNHPALLASVGAGRVLGLLPLSTGAVDETATELAAELAGRGMNVAVSTPRRTPDGLHEALREAELLVELSTTEDAPVAGQEETYRLLIGVLLRDREELEQLQARTISALVEYDVQHDTELVPTLQAFLARHGSTTETAEAMGLHRHTVGYRLARVHEVAGLSPYESDGRERLSLGLKAHQILRADQRRSQRE